MPNRGKEDSKAQKLTTVADKVHVVGGMRPVGDIVTALSFMSRGGDPFVVLNNMSGCYASDMASSTSYARRTFA